MQIQIQYTNTIYKANTIYDLGSFKFISHGRGLLRRGRLS